MRYVSLVYSYVLHRLFRLNCRYAEQLLVFGRYPRRVDSSGCCCVENGGEPLYLRPRSTDSRVFSQIFRRQEYAFSLDIYRRFFGNPSTIMDLGANIGLASRYFVSQFPAARVVCVEPHQNNFHVLKRNMECVPGATCIQCAVWSRNEKLQLQQGFRDGGAWAFQYKPRINDMGDGLAEGRTLRSILNELSMDSIDFLKIDIEGAEKEVVFNSEEFLAILQSVRMIALEVHPESVSLIDAHDFFREHGFKVYTWGETMNAVNTRFLP